MPKLVLCFKEGEEEGKFQDAKKIPKGWIIDREMPKEEPEEVPVALTGSAPRLNFPPTTDGLNITGQPDSFKEGSTIGENKVPALRKKPGPKPKAKPEG